MLTKAAIETCLAELNEILRKSGRRGEMGLIGGAVMCLVYDAREATFA